MSRFENSGCWWKEKVWFIVKLIPSVLNGKVEGQMFPAVGTGNVCTEDHF